MCAAFRDKPWACSIEDVPWHDEGRESNKLRMLGFEYGFFYDSHRALADCEAGLHLLAAVRLSRFGDKTAFAALLASARGGRIFFTADGSPFETKDLLRERRYRWNPARRVWGRDVEAKDAPAGGANGWKKISTPTARATASAKSRPTPASRRGRRGNFFCNAEFP